MTHSGDRAPPPPFPSGLAGSRPIFEDLLRHVRENGWSDWPDCSALNAMHGLTARTVDGKPIRFCPQDHALPFPGLSYESRIRRTGIVSTRERNWHDLFNALMWRQWPALKAAMNAAHCRDETIARPGNRSRLRDAVTLLDESGVIVAASDQRILEALREHRWVPVFGDQRGEWGRGLNAFIVGHALYEKALAPYPAMTARSVLVEVDTEFFALRATEQQALLDRQVSAFVNGSPGLREPGQLGVLPLAGVPRWKLLGEATPALEDATIFRPRSRRAGAMEASITSCKIEE